MTGETITIYSREPGAKDPLGNLTYTESESEVDNVLVEPVTGVDLDDSNRPDGVEIKYRIHMPKTWVFSEQRTLRGAAVDIRGRRLYVIGDPDHFELQNTPTEWCMPVLLSEVEG